MTRPRSALTLASAAIMALFGAMFSALVAAQEPAPALPAPPQSDGYTYNPAGRRDPFVSLLFRGSDGTSQSRSLSGVAGLAVADITVKGIVVSREGYVAMIQAPDNRTYLVRPNDRFLDGRVKSVSALEMIISQDVKDPLSLVKQRDVHKPLRPMDQGQ